MYLAIIMAISRGGKQHITQTFYRKQSFKNIRQSIPFYLQYEFFSHPYACLA